MGRPRKSTSLKLLAGAQPCRLKKDDPASPKGAGQCPDHLDAVGAAAWHRVVSRLDEMGVLTHADSESIALYASIYQQWQEARVQVEIDGMTSFSPLGLMKPHPLLSVIKECRSQMTRLLTQFGMTPSSRSSLHVPGQPEADPILAFIAQPKAGSQKKA